MLKSTHSVFANGQSNVARDALPTGWTEHRAPTGHLYYYNTETKQSTYTRPVKAPEAEDLIIDYGATQPDQEVQASMSVMQAFHSNNDPSQQRAGYFTGGRSYQTRDRDQSRPNRQGDRAKSKADITDCTPWVLVKTKYGRRFVHNTETKESFWKFPSEVMMAVVEMDRLQWEKTQKVDVLEVENKVQVPQTAQPHYEQKPVDYDSEEYEEVEVTDDENDTADRDPASKRPRIQEPQEDQLSAQVPPGPQEFDEDDIAWQLAQMEADDEDPGYDYDYDEDDEQGIPLTNDDRDALFRNLLDEFRISPFSTFDALIDTNSSIANVVISDERWTALSNMSSRRAAFDSWSRDRIAAQKAIEDVQDIDSSNANGATKRGTKLDPRIAYLRFLAKEASSKLYWPEFKRKFRKAPEMTDRYFQDKDREKLYREYVTKLKQTESDRKKDFTALLKAIPANEWHDNKAPTSVEKDLRYYGVRDEQDRQDLVETFASTLPRE